MESESSACHCDVRLKPAIKGKVMTQHAVVAVISSYRCPPVGAKRICAFAAAGRKENFNLIEVQEVKAMLHAMLSQLKLEDVDDDDEETHCDVEGGLVEDGDVEEELYFSDSWEI
ncbi:hypothetical protein E1301_Tti017297 [Triplophysa tibetana]|uniref:Uncharacterized protein n=1 Tax=Triplophysa tibetana TaxID=1572043 RepID=A0A5A9P962_9TELE|nr:hypothetical protein E1301_Tti017297 [Triplophysa tibetana]